MHRSRLALFLSCSAAFLLIPAIYPSARLYYFAPFLVTSFYQCGYASSLWCGILCGILVDFFSDLPFGINALAYSLTTFLLFRRRRHFFPDRAMTLSIMTFLFAWVSTVWLWLILYLLGDKSGLTLKTFAGDFGVMPLMDAFYAFIFFTLPVFLFGKPLRRGSDYFLSGRGH